MKQKSVDLRAIVDDFSEYEKEYEVFDIEANYWTNEMLVGHYDGHEFRYFESTKEFLDFLFEREKSCTIYAHNGGAYDMLFVLQYLIRNYKPGSYEIDKFIPRGSSILTFQVLKNHTKIGPRGGRKSFTQKITFVDSLALLPFSLKKLTESFGVESTKTDWDHDRYKYICDELINYLEIDCKGLYESLKVFFNWPMVRRVKPAMTMASQAMKVFQTTMLHNIHSLRGWDEEFVRGSYFGGRTEIFKPFYIHKDSEYLKNTKNKMLKSIKENELLNYYDVNSLYPFVMRDNEFPVAVDQRPLSIKWDKLGVWDCEVEVPKDMWIPPLGLAMYIDPKTKEIRESTDNKPGKFIFPVGRFRGRWTTQELEYACSLGVKIIRCYGGVTFKSGGKIFKDFIEMLYAIRVNPKSSPVDNMIAKLLMNSCYGRFGINTLREQMVVDDGRMPIVGSTWEFPFEDQGQVFKTRFAKVEEEVEMFSNVAIAAYVTSYARIHMHKQYMKCKEVYYTDTDSILTTSQFEEGKGLGFMKLELQAEAACFLLPKSYSLIPNKEWAEKLKIQYGTSKTALKGVSLSKADIGKLNPMDFLAAYEGDFKALKFEVPEKMSRMSGAMRHGTFLHVSEASTKEIRAMYDKRVIIKDSNTFTTEPIIIANKKAINYRG